MEEFHDVMLTKLGSLSRHHAAIANLSNNKWLDSAIFSETPLRKQTDMTNVYLVFKSLDV